MKHLSQQLLLLVLLTSCALFSLAQDKKPSSSEPPPPPPPPAAEYNSKVWKEFAPAAGGFSVLMPGTPVLTSKQVDIEAGQAKVYMYLVRTGIGVYEVSYFDLAQSANDLNGIKKILDDARDEFIAETKDKVLNENEIALEGNIGRELIVFGRGSINTVRYFLINGRVYQLMFLTYPNVVFNSGKPGSNMNEHTDFYKMITNKFFGSFKLLDRASSTSTTIK